MDSVVQQFAGEKAHADLTNRPVSLQRPSDRNFLLAALATARGDKWRPLADA
jgi:hypothetical protein